MKTIEADGKRKTFASRFSGKETKQTSLEGDEDEDDCARLRERGWTSKVAGNLCPMT